MSDPLDDDDSSPLGGLSALAPTAPLSRDQMQVPPYLQRQFDVGQSLLGDADDVTGGLDAAMQARKAAGDKKMQAIDAAIQRLTATAPTSGPDRINVPALAAATGFLSPTRAGGFNVALGQAGKELIPALQNQRNAEGTYAQNVNNLELLKAQALEASSGLDYEDLVNRTKLGSGLLTNAAKAETARRNALMRSNGAYKPMIKVIPGVGLVEAVPGANGQPTTTRTLVSSPDPHNDPKVRVAYLRMIQNTTKDYRFDSPEHRMAYESDLADAALRTGTPLSQGVIQLDLSAHGIRPGGAQPAPAGGAPPQPVPAGGAPGPVATPPVAAPGFEPEGGGAGAPGPVAVQAAPPIPPPAAPAIAAPRQITPYTLEAEKEEGKSDALLATKEADAARTQAEVASGTLATGQALSAIAAPTGRLAPAKQWLGSWAEAMGIPAPKAIAAANKLSTFNAIATDVVLNKQIEQKGVQTEGDAQRMRDTYAQIKNPIEANNLIIRHADALAKRSIDKSQFMEDYKASHGTYIGARAAWLKNITEVPIAKRINNKPVFFHEFLDAARNDPDNKGLPDLDAHIIEDWKSLKDK